MEAIQVKLSEKDLKDIKELTRKGWASVRVLKRAQIIKFRHLGLGTSEILELLDVDSKMISVTLNNFLEFGLETTIYDAPRTGRPIEFDDRNKSNIVAMVCSNPPDGYASWTLDLIAEESINRELVDTISKSKIQVILQEHDLKPWREKMWCIPELSDEYIHRMEDILSVYERPYDSKKPVVCLDEKPVALIGDTRDRIPGEPGKIAKKDYEYTRNGSANVFCAVEPLSGVFVNKVTENRKMAEFSKILNQLSKCYSSAETIILVMDNLNTHKEASLIEHYGEEKGRKIWNRFEVHYTPKHASWLNQAEIAIGMYARQCLGDGRVGSIENLREQTKHWNRSVNKKKKIIKWEFTRKKAREKFNYDL